MMGGGTGAYALHWSGGAARCVRSHIPGALSILKGAVPGRARGLGHMAPTYFRREPGIATPAANAAPHSCSTLVSDSGRDPDQPGTRAPATSYSLDVISSPIAAAKSDLRTVAVARRDGLPAAERMAAAEA